MKPNFRIILLCLTGSAGLLLASPETDRAAESSAASSYNFQVVLEGRVQVQVRDGVATLTGVVRDEEEKTLAEDTVANLPGVTRIRNDINIEFGHSDRSDAWIAFKIRSRLLVRRHVSAADTLVEVHAGVVTLKGTAESHRQKELTGACASSVAGVKRVRNEMVVKPVAVDKRTPAERIDDASITAQIKLALLTHKATSALRTKLHTEHGVVVITGQARSKKEISLVTSIAEDVKGVVAVKNEMTVKP